MLTDWQPEKELSLPVSPITQFFGVNYGKISAISHFSG